MWLPRDQLQFLYDGIFIRIITNIIDKKVLIGNSFEHGSFDH